MNGSKMRGGNPEGAETSGGERVAVSLNRRAATTNRWSDQSLEVEWSELEREGQLFRRRGPQTARRHRRVTNPAG
jgi:hypothetical protein